MSKEVEPYVYVFRDHYRRAPGGRYIRNGDFSGEHFREHVLVPLLKIHEHILISLDGCARFHVDFVDEAFRKGSMLYGPGFATRIRFSSIGRSPASAFDRLRAEERSIRMEEVLYSGIDWLRYWAGECNEEAIKYRGDR